MYYRYELHPSRNQFLTAAIGADGKSYFLYRDVRKLLAQRKPEEFYRCSLDKWVTRKLQLRDVLPKGTNCRFKYQHYYVLDICTMMDILYSWNIKLYFWFQDMREKRKVNLVNPEKFEEILKYPHLSSNPTKMPGFVLANDDDLDARWLMSEYLPLLVNATMEYYQKIDRHIAIQQQPDESEHQQPDALLQHLNVLQQKLNVQPSVLEQQQPDALKQQLNVQPSVLEQQQPDALKQPAEAYLQQLNVQPSEPEQQQPDTLKQPLSPIDDKPFMRQMFGNQGEPEMTSPVNPQPNNEDSVPMQEDTLSFTIKTEMEE